MSGGITGKLFACAARGQPAVDRSSHPGHLYDDQMSGSPSVTPPSSAPVRQERMPASPDVTEVAPGVLRLQLPIALPGLAHINAYAILDDHGASIVDPGLPGPDSWRDLQDRLAKADVRMTDIHTVLITHSHPDHYGNAMRLCTESGAKLVTHRAFRTMFEGNHNCTVDDCDDPGHAHPDVGQDDLPDQQARGMYASMDAPAPWGGTFAPQKDNPELRSQTLMLADRGWTLPVPDKRVRHGEILPIGHGRWQVIHTPGHTLDHLCLFDPEHGTFISGDHVLPTITPHISGMGSGPDPLDSFFSSLDTVAELPDVGRCLPAHGDVFDDLPGRAKDIKEHHAERLARLLSVSRDLDTWADVEEFSHHLFRQERWGSMAQSETYAHLEHLRIHGDAAFRVADNGRAEYRAIDPELAASH